MRIFAALLLLISFAVHSETTSGIYYGFFTDHVLDDDVYNEENHVILLQHNDWYLGTFSNSFAKRSYVVAWSFWDYRKDFGHNSRYNFDSGWHTTTWFVEFNAAVGAATGYQDTPNRTVLGLSPALIGAFDVGRSHEQFEYGVRTMYIPKNVLNAGLFFNFKY